MSLHVEAGSNSRKLTIGSGSFAWVTMKVGHGENKKEFQVHHGVLSHHSSLFSEKLRDDPVNFGSLPDEDPDTFSIVIDWMYARGIWDPKTNLNQNTPLSFRQVLSMYFCADKYRMTALHNETLSLIYQMTVKDQEELLSQAEVIYENAQFEDTQFATHPSSTLRQFLVDFVVNRWCFTPDSPTLYDKLQRDVLVQLQSWRKPPGALMYEEEWIKHMNKNLCPLYHIHADDKDDDEVEDPNYPSMM